MHVFVDNTDKRLPSARRSIPFPLITVLCGIALPVLIIEIALRFLPVASATATMAVDEVNPIVRFTPNQPFTFSKGWQFAMVNSGHINNYGFINAQDYTSQDQRQPLIIIGDSYVEAMMVPYQETVQGRLATLLENKRKVYSIGVSGAQLAQYLAFAEYAWTEFTPGALVFVIVGNDFDESLSKYDDNPGFHHFQEVGNQDLKLVRTDYRPSLGKQLLRKSAVARYLWATVGINTIPSLFAQRFEDGVQYVGNTVAYASNARLADSRRVVDRFFLELPQRVGLAKSHYLFIVDALRPEIYSDSDLTRARASYFDLMRQYFLEQAKSNGYEAIDMEPRFISRHQRDGSRFEFALDGHWNGLGHQVAADAIASSRTLELFLSRGDERSPR